MRFEDVLHNGKLWAVVYDGDSQNILTKTFANWLNPAFLEDFFIRNSKDWIHCLDPLKTNVFGRCSFLEKRQREEDRQHTALGLGYMQSNLTN